MAVFGRDSLITSFQALPFVPELAATDAARAGGLRQGTRVDDFRDEEPGKILHEPRWGELTAFEERPHSPYFGARRLDAAVSDPARRVRALDRRPRARATSSSEQARAALELDRPLRRPRRRRLRRVRAAQQGDRPRQPVLEGLAGTRSRSPTADCAELPRATCEIQGYVYDAKMRCARLAREIWNDPELADRARARRQPSSSGASTATSGSPERGSSRSRSTATSSTVDSLTSNIGHLLWSGIVDDDKADDVVRAPDERRSCSRGWGIRTMADGEARYNPIGYHVGTVWPHDNSIIAARPAPLRHGAKRPRAWRWASSTRPSYFNHRLPEAFAGYPRDAHAIPGRVSDRVQPAGVGDRRAAAAVARAARPRAGRRAPAGRAGDAAVDRSASGLLGIPGRWGRADAFGRGRIELEPHKQHH